MHLLNEIRPMQVAGDVFFLTKDIFFSHRIHRFNRHFLRTVSSPQNAFGIQRTQSITANENTNKEAKSSLHPAHRGISVITPLPFGGGEGGGATILWARKDDCLSDTDGENGHINRLNDVVHQALQPYCRTSSSFVIS